jgi:protein-S-isoprenylcysteine O-methyltransferase Ste14
MKRFAVLIYGLFAYVTFLSVFLYAVGFVGNFGAPTTLDGPADAPVAQAIGVNLLLLGLFAVQHSVMARPCFKRWWTRIVPEPMGRSTYVLFTNVALAVLYWLWQPMGGVV